MEYQFNLYRLSDRQIRLAIGQSRDRAGYMPVKARDSRCREKPRLG
jgi:hypothetical protein